MKSCILSHSLRAAGASCCTVQRLNRSTQNFGRCRQAGQPAVSAGEEGGQRLVVMAIEGGDAVRAVVLHAPDIAGAAVSQLHAVDDALLCQLLQLDRLELIAAEAGLL